MKKIILRTLTVILLTILFSSVGKLTPDRVLMNTIFTVSGIMFSIGLGLIVNFNLYEIKNDWYLKRIRKNLNGVRNSFIFYFTLSTLCFLLFQYISLEIFSIGVFKFNFPIFFLIVMLFSIGYYIVNLIDIQKLNDEIIDKLNREGGK